jgi:uncharacterized membrane protein
VGFRFSIIAIFAFVIFSAFPQAWAVHPPAEHNPPVSEAANSVEPEPASQESREVAQDAEPIEADAVSELAMPDPQPTHAGAHEHAVDMPCGDGEHSDGAAVPGGASGHAHWGEDGASTPFERTMSRIGVFHSVAVHFPIALILAAALAQLLVATGRFANGADTVRFLVWTGAMGGVVAALLGWAHSGPMGAAETGVMLSHRLIGSSVIAGLIGLVLLFEWSRRSGTQLAAILFNLVLAALALAMLVNGFLGGALAHGGLRHLIGAG